MWRSCSKTYGRSLVQLGPGSRAKMSVLGLKSPSGRPSYPGIWKCRRAFDTRHEPRWTVKAQTQRTCRPVASIALDVAGKPIEWAQIVIALHFAGRGLWRGIDPCV